MSNVWILPWLAALVALGSNASDWLRYALLTGLLSYPYCHAILVAWNSRNSSSVRTRAVSAALYNMFVQAGNIVGTNIYREDDRPFYIRGNKILLAICCFNIVLFNLVKYYYVTRNKRREAAWSKLTGEEKVDYVQTTNDEGAKRLDFKFSHWGRFVQSYVKSLRSIFRGRSVPGHMKEFFFYSIMYAANLPYSPDHKCLLSQLKKDHVSNIHRAERLQGM